MIKIAVYIYSKISEAFDEVDLTDLWIFPVQAWPVLLDPKWFEQDQDS
jgi:hypothetical protein